MALAGNIFTQRGEQAKELVKSLKFAGPVKS
jgi:hypothetical protein